MCGLLMVHSFTKPVNTATFNHALASIHHRGPDDSGTLFAQDSGQKIYFALGHDRLAIHDDLTARQPFTSVDGAWHGAVNGEIYNGLDGRTKAAFTTASDSGILLNAFVANGSAGLASLDGEFAFAAFDEQSNKSYLARDPHGIKPLYYTVHDGQLIAASEIKALLEYGVPRRWNINYLINSEAFVQDAQQTFVENVFAVPPGHVLEFSSTGLTISSYLHKSPLEPSLYSLSGLNFVDAKTIFRDLLHQAVIKRLSTKQENASYLSGGIDSAVVTAIAAKNATVTAFTLGFEHKEMDESKAAQTLAHSLMVKHHHVLVSDSDLAEHFASAIYHCEMPVPNMNVAAKYLLSRKVKDAGFKIALTGEGADESLLGYGFFRQDIEAPYCEGSWWCGLHGIKKRLGYVPAQLVTATRHNDIYADLRRDDYADVFPDVEALYASLNDAQEAIRVSQELHYRSCFQTYNLGALGDKTEMAHGVEGRPPFLDNNLVEFIHQLPTKYKFSNGIDKVILRSVANDLLPIKGYAQTPKKPFLAAPCSLQSKGPIAELFQHYLLGTQTVLPIYETRKIQQLYTEALTMNSQQKTALDPLFVHLCSLMILRERFGLQT